MTVALITVTPLTVIGQWPEPPSRLVIPGVGDVHGADIGWVSGNYMLAALIKFVPPAGRMITGNPSYVLNGTTLTESYATVPLPSGDLAHAAYDAAIGSGIVLTWTTSTTLNGKYALDDRTMGRLNSIWTVVLANGAFPNNKTRQPWLQMDGTQVTFTSPQFNLFGTAVSNYAAALEEARVAQVAGGSPTWPSNAVTVTG